MSALPQRFDSVEALEDFMTEPTPGLIADLAQMDGDIIVIGGLIYMAIGIMVMKKMIDFDF